MCCGTASILTTAIFMSRPLLMSHYASSSDSILMNIHTFIDTYALLPRQPCTVLSMPLTGRHGSFSTLCIAPHTPKPSFRCTELLPEYPHISCTASCPRPRSLSSHQVYTHFSNEIY
ncbi:hypothetical protein FIBSPDRAFT_343824 [Athelia psychrophila]|uniref:Uncharacterized protein n=1 Tax=Athelia psychrophila TaxID=1759441 RepID=A0A167W4Z5_9AGAM|nr:hypothetical protein FIBSPDRAFT_343824 [Fibularhizoctonia sp. CBS 109695]